MKIRRLVSVSTALLLAVSLLSISVPAQNFKEPNAPGVLKSVSDADRIAKIEARFEARRKELGIPGMSVAIVKDGKVILSKGYGYKDFEKKIPMTPETQLAIGSASKAFTALSVLMLQDEGKLSLDDHPRTHLPYFKINNPDTNEKIQVRDLLSHSSGLNRTDLAMIAGKLNRKELIKVAGIAKPMAGLREKFYYQNLMFTAAGEIVAEVAGMPWEKFVPRRIFAPIGMNNSTMSVKAMQKADDYSFGYSYNFDTKKTKKLPTRDLGPVGPAGSINSSSNDMAKWLNFVLSGGVANGKSLLSENTVDEWLKPQMKITPNGKVSYGLGWFVQEWKSKKVVQHGGNIDGFNSMVAMVPEEKLGFVMLTNVTASSLGGEMMNMVWSGMLDEIKKEQPGSDFEKEVGSYIFKDAGFDLVVEIEEGKLVAKVPNQPTYILINEGGRKYSLSNAPAGFFITFKEGEAFLEQPQGDVTLKKRGAASSEDSDKKDNSVDEMAGAYQSVQNVATKVEIKEIDGKVSLKVGAQPAYALKRKEKDLFALENLPPAYMIKAIRGDDGRVTAMKLVQPEGEFEFKRISKTEKKNAPLISSEELIAKVVDALGGEESLRKITSRKTVFKLDAIHQGVKGYGTAWAKAPGMSYSETKLTALGKDLGWSKEYFDGEKGGERYSFAPEEKYSGKRLRDVKFGNDFAPFLDLENKIERSEVLGESKVDGKPVYVFAVYPKDSSRIVYQISKESFLPLRTATILVSSTSAQQLPVSSNYSDYRAVDGLMIPFKIISTNPAMGDIVTTITEVKHNIEIDNKIFDMK